MVYSSHTCSHIAHNSHTSPGERSLPPSTLPGHAALAARPQPPRTAESDLGTAWKAVQELPLPDAARLYRERNDRSFDTNAIRACRSASHTPRAGLRTPPCGLVTSKGHLTHAGLQCDLPDELARGARRVCCRRGTRIPAPIARDRGASISARSTAQAQLLGTGNTCKAFLRATEKLVDRGAL